MDMTEDIATNTTTKWNHMKEFVWEREPDQ